MASGYELLVGLALGFSLTIPPGPMNAFIASQSVRSLRAGITAGAGALSADLVLGVVVYLLETVVDLQSFVRVVYVLGCAVMVFFAYRLLAPPRDHVPTDAGGVKTYSHALALGISNPFQILWWLTVGLAFAYLGGIVLFVGLFGAIAVWIVVFPWALHAGTRRHPGLQRGVVWASGAILLAFAVYFAILAA